MTPFANILRTAVERTPMAIGGAFADADGELVDQFAPGDPFQMAVITAHYGVIMQHLVDAFGTWHFGSPEYFIAVHERLEVVVHAVDLGYYALIASRQPAPEGIALESLHTAAVALKQEMGI